MKNSEEKDKKFFSICKTFNLLCLYSKNWLEGKVNYHPILNKTFHNNKPMNGTSINNLHMVMPKLNSLGFLTLYYQPTLSMTQKPLSSYSILENEHLNGYIKLIPNLEVSLCQRAFVNGFMRRDDARKLLDHMSKTGIIIPEIKKNFDIDYTLTTTLCPAGEVNSLNHKNYNQLIRFLHNNLYFSDSCLDLKYQNNIKPYFRFGNTFIREIDFSDGFYEGLFGNLKKEETNDIVFVSICSRYFVNSGCRFPIAFWNEIVSALIKIKAENITPIQISKSS